MNNIIPISFCMDTISCTAMMSRLIALKNSLETMDDLVKFCEQDIEHLDLNIDGVSPIAYEPFVNGKSSYISIHKYATFASNTRVLIRHLRGKSAFILDITHENAELWTYDNLQPSCDIIHDRVDEAMEFLKYHVKATSEIKAALATTKAIDKFHKIGEMLGKIISYQHKDDTKWSLCGRGRSKPAHILLESKKNLDSKYLKHKIDSQTQTYLDENLPTIFEMTQAFRFTKNQRLSEHMLFIKPYLSKILLYQNLSPVEIIKTHSEFKEVTWNPTIS